MVKLLVTDLDGTLIFKGHRVHDTDIQALRSLHHDHGTIIAIATGRHKGEIFDFYQRHGIGSFFISSNGAHIVDEHHTPLLSTTIPADDIHAILSFAERFSVYRIISDDEQYICENKTWLLSLLERIQGFQYTSKKDFRQHMDAHDVRKLMFFGRPSVLKEMQLEFQAYFSKYDCCFTSKYSLEIVPKNYSKGTAVQFLMNHLQLSPDDIAVIGDSENDLSMFSLPVTSYTFHHAKKHVQEAATHCVPSVAHMVQHVKKSTKKDVTMIEKTNTYR